MVTQKNRMYCIPIVCRGCRRLLIQLLIDYYEIGVEKHFYCQKCKHEYRFNKNTNTWSWEELS